MDRIQFAALWSLLTHAYPTSNVLSSEGTAAVYFNQLKDLDAEWVLHGTSRCVDESKFPPTIAELRIAAETERDSRVTKGALPSVVVVGDHDTIPMPWYYRLQWLRLSDKKPAGHPLLEDADQLRAECGERGIEIDVWPAVPRWYGARRPIPIEGEVDHHGDCSGLLVSEFEATAKPIYAPCSVCQPGRRRLFEAGLWSVLWQHNERAVRVYVRAELEAGNLPVGPVYEDQPIIAMWRRVIKDRGREPVEAL